jgi:hypothetical protein
VKVRLSIEEFQAAVLVAVARHKESRIRGYQHTAGFEPASYSAEIEGACAEMAVAKAVDRYWDMSVGRIGGSRDGDVGQLEIRQTDRADGSLIVRPGDNPARPFVLVTGRNGRYTVHGWITGQEARRPEWVREPNGRPKAWFVPQQALRPLSTLPRPPRVSEDPQLKLTGTD